MQRPTTLFRGALGGHWRQLEDLDHSQQVRRSARYRGHEEHQYSKKRLPKCVYPRHERRRCRRLQPCCAVSAQTCSTVFTLASLYTAPFVLLVKAPSLCLCNHWASPNLHPNPQVKTTEQMLLAPRARLTQRLIQSELSLAPVALAYGYLLLHSWEPDTLQLILPGSLKEGFSGGGPEG